MITGSLSRLPQATRQGPVVGLRHKGVFPRSGGARRPGLWVGQRTGPQAQAERATAADNYWSSTTNAGNSSNAWNVNFNDGNVNNDDKNNALRVRAVRGGW
jgi:Protein of unknown function (DUF1566)